MNAQTASEGSATYAPASHPALPDFPAADDATIGTVEDINRCVVSRISTLAELRQLSAEWNPLLRASQSMTVFLTWQWQESWAERFLNDHRSLFVLCVRRAGALLAIAPWYIETVRRGPFLLREVRFVGSPESGSDYLDVMLDTGKERLAAEALFEFLFGAGREEWDELRLTDVPAESLFLLHFLNVVEEHGKFVELRRHAYLPQTALTADFDTFFAALSANRRYRVRTDMRRLAKEGAYEHVTYRGDDIARGLTRFFALYDKMSGYFDGPRLAPFLHQLCKLNDAREWVQVDILAVAGRDISALLHLRFGDNLAMLKMVVDKKFNRRVAAGNLLLSMSIQRAIADGAKCYDFLKGDEDYKFHWARSGRVTLSIRLVQRQWRPLLVTASRLLKYVAKVLIR